MCCKLPEVILTVTCIEQNILNSLLCGLHVLYNVQLLADKERHRVMFTVM